MDTAVRKIFLDQLFHWYSIHKRDLPWRNTTNPYFILLSEVILQQTRVEQGLPYYHRFIENYPTLNALANAEEEEILRLWQGLGYYSRARNLHQTAKQIQQRFQGIIPDDFNQLLSLKGIGIYTASAIASFAFQLPYAVVDGNVYRVLARVFGIEEDISTSKGVKFFQEIANQLLPDKNHSIYNQAIMEFGATHCTPRKPFCATCDIQSICSAYANNTQDILPFKSKKVVKTNRYINYIVFKSDDTYAMNKRLAGDIWEGLYDFYIAEPIKYEANEEDIMNFLNSIGLEHTLNYTSQTFKHLLTHQNLFVKYFLVEIQDVNKILSLLKIDFYPIDEIFNLPKPILITRFLEHKIFT
ncbi:MAG: A/G-specific adenine glycosylase [Cytophagales bacterium]|nr:MAG: A/G-specific adenine glycosylase [Cytophagales bacterium]